MPSAPRSSRRGRLDRPTPPPVTATQIDLFPERPVVELLDPRVVVGPRTATSAVIRVRLRSIEAPHLIFHDRHGWYCDTHGVTCDAVAVARAVTRDGSNAAPSTDAADALE